MQKLSLLLLLLLGLLATRPGAAHAQTGAALLQKAAALEKAGNLPAAIAAYNQANTVFGRTGDLDGKQQALTKLAELNERLANQYLQQSKTGPAAPAPMTTTAAPVVARAQPAPRPVAPAAPAAGATPVAPLAGSVAGGRPVGLFFMSRYLMALHSLEKATYYFTPGGQVVVNPTGFSAAALAALPPGQRGSYTLAGNKLTVRWANGQTEDSNVEPQATTFGWDMGLFLAVRPFANARQLAGSFEGGNSVSLGGGSTAVVSGLTFRPDGTFTRSSTNSLSSTDAAGTARAGASGTGTGRWSLSGWLLTLTDAQGQATQGVSYPIETDDKTGQVTRFYYGSMAYKRL